jgi:rod shape-determining protein MreC
MPRKVNSLPYFLVFFTLSIFLILLGTTGLLDGIFGLINKSASPVRTATFNLLTLPAFTNKNISQLTAENQLLGSQLAKTQVISADDQALRDQFAQTKINPLTLLPAKVVGYPSFIPGESNPTYLVIDKGSADGVKTGNAIILNNNLVGKVVLANASFSKVALVTSEGSFAAKTGKSGEILGVAKGDGNSILLDNVLLSQTLVKGDLVMTKGDLNEKGEGYPPDLVIGKIVSVDKKPSALFQKAEVQSFVNFKNLSTVFVFR